jgi:heme-degrading monooxygenase HmoA
MAESAGGAKGRVVFVLQVKRGMEGQFLDAYESMRHDVARGVKGHIVDQVCRSPEEPDSWLITSEWESLDDFLAWEATEEHRELAKPLRDCIDRATSLKYVVVKETRAGQSA